MMNTPTQPLASPQFWTRLAQPFDPEEVALKVQAYSRDRSRGLVFPYVDARAVMMRLDDVAGPGNWEDRYDTWGESGDRVSVKCTLTILGVTKEDAGEGRDYKSAVSDALKRAAVKFGIGRYLYATPDVWADLDEQGRILEPAKVKARILGAPAPPTGSRKEAPRGTRNTHRSAPNGGVVGQVFRDERRRRSA